MSTSLRGCFGALKMRFLLFFWAASLKLRWWWGGSSSTHHQCHRNWASLRESREKQRALGWRWGNLWVWVVMMLHADKFSPSFSVCFCRNCKKKIILRLCWKYTCKGWWQNFVVPAGLSHHSPDILSQCLGAGGMAQGLCIPCSPAEETGALHKCCHVCRPVQSPFFWALLHCLGRIRGMNGGDASGKEWQRAWRVWG